MLKSRGAHDRQQLCSHFTLATHWHLCSEFNHDPLILFSVNSITTAYVLSNEYAHSFIRPLLSLWMEVNSNTILFALSVNPITFPFFFFHCGLVNPITTFQLIASKIKHTNIAISVAFFFRQAPCTPDNVAFFSPFSCASKLIICFSNVCDCTMF